jgi:hypothetical protein
MTRVTPVVQPLSGKHYNLLLELLHNDAISEVVLSSAFVQSTAIRQLEPALSRLHVPVIALVGVRNGATSLQGVLALLQCGVRVYVLDTGRVGCIYHPKVYIVTSGASASLVIGSANLTFAGMNNNIEFGVRLDLDIRNQADITVLREIRSSIDHFIAIGPPHCFEVATAREAIRLLRRGLVSDERTIRSSVGAASRRAPGQAESPTPPINLPFVRPPPRIGVAPRKSMPRLSRLRLEGAIQEANPTRYGGLLWEKTLSRRDAQVPEAGSNPTGVLSLTQAGFRVGNDRINPTRYFRYEVFTRRPWHEDRSDPTKEMTAERFQLHVASQDCGIFDMSLSHKPAWEAGQHNYTTALHWGPGTPYIKHTEYVGRTLRLYGPATINGPFLLEID